MNAQSNDVCVRPAAEPDLPRIAELLDQLLAAMSDPAAATAAQRESNIFHFMATPNASMWAAEPDHRIVGVISVAIRRTLLHPSPVLLIDELVVDEACRGHGVGRRLIREVFASAREEEAGEVEVCTEKTNLPAGKFYAACGFDREHLLLECELGS